MAETKDLIESNARTTCEVAVKAMVSAVPALGGPLSSIMGDLQNIRKEKRFIEFMEKLLIKYLLC